MILYRPGSPLALWYCLASLMTVSTASEPDETKNVLFKSPGAISAILDASSRLLGCWKLQFGKNPSSFICLAATSACSPPAPQDPSSRPYTNLLQVEPRRLLTLHECYTVTVIRSRVRSLIRGSRLSDQGRPTLRTMMRVLRYLPDPSALLARQPCQRPDPPRPQGHPAPPAQPVPPRPAFRRWVRVGPSRLWCPRDRDPGRLPRWIPRWPSMSRRAPVSGPTLPPAGVVPSCTPTGSGRPEAGP